MERSELVDIFKDSPAEWANLHDRVVSDSDHGRTLIQFVAQIEMNDTSRRGEKHVGRKKQVAQKSVHNSQALVIDLLDSDLEDDDNDDEVQVVKQDPESSNGSGNNEQNQGRHSSSNPEHSILSEQSWSDRFSQSSKRKRAAPSRFTVSTKTVEEAKNKTQQSSARSKGPRRLNVGDRVYAEWPKTQSWYWGKIEAINTGREGVTYNVRFDDGDLRKRTARKVIPTQCFLERFFFLYGCLRSQCFFNEVDIPERGVWSTHRKRPNGQGQDNTKETVGKKPQQPNFKT